MKASEIVKLYFDFFNSGDRKGMASLLHPELNHEVNQGETRIGIHLFSDFMKNMDRCYNETLKEIVIMTSSDTDTRLAAEFIVEGEYIKTDTGLPEARNQKYCIAAGSFFEVREEKIVRITTYYNLPKWIRMVQ